MMTYDRQSILAQLEEKYGREELSPLLRKHERFETRHPDADDAESAGHGHKCVCPSL